MTRLHACHGFQLDRRSDTQSAVRVCALTLVNPIPQRHLPGPRQGSVCLAQSIVGVFCLFVLCIQLTEVSVDNSVSIFGRRLQSWGIAIFVGWEDLCVLVSPTFMANGGSGHRIMHDARQDWERLPRPMRAGAPY